MATGTNSENQDMIVKVESLIVNGNSLSGTELGYVDGITPGTVTASKAVVVDSNKDASAFRAVGVVDLDAGSSGAAGTVDIFPTTASKGKIQIAAADSAGNTTTTITNASQTTTAIETIPDTNGNAEFVMTKAAQTIAAVKTFSSMFKIPINTPVAGAGTVIGDAAPVLTGFTVITGANGTVGWILPVTTGGDVVILKGTTAGVAKLWPQSGGQINAVGTSTAMSLASGVIPVILISISATQWYTIPLLPS